MYKKSVKKVSDYLLDNYNIDSQNRKLTVIIFYLEKDRVMNIAKVGRRGQIILPRAVREFLEIKEGDRLSFVNKGTEIVLKPITKTLVHLRGSVPVSKRQDFKAIRKQVIKAHVQKRAEHGD